MFLLITLLILYGARTLNRILIVHCFRLFY